MSRSWTAIRIALTWGYPQHVKQLCKYLLARKLSFYTNGDEVVFVESKDTSEVALYLRDNKIAYTVL